MKALIAFVIIVSLGLVGCASQVPVPTTYPLTYQQKMQAAHHWDVLASDVAQRLGAALNSLGAEDTLVLHVRPADELSVFGRAFYNLLATQLMQQGFGVSVDPAEASLEVLYDVQVVTHNDRGFIRPTPGLFTGLTAGVLVLRELATSSVPEAAALAGAVAADIGTGYITGPTPDSEVIITTSVMSGNRFVTRISDLYYISDNNTKQYIACCSGVIPTRAIGVVGP